MTGQKWLISSIENGFTYQTSHIRCFTGSTTRPFGFTVRVDIALCLIYTTLVAKYIATLTSTGIEINATGKVAQVGSDTLCPSAQETVSTGKIHENLCRMSCLTKGNRE